MNLEIRENKEDVFEGVLNDAMDFLTDHEAKVIKEKGTSEWTIIEDESETEDPGLYQIPAVDIVFSCINCNYSYHFSVGKTPEGIDILSYHVNVKDCPDDYSSENPAKSREKLEKIIQENLRDREISKKENY